MKLSNDKHQTPKAQPQRRAQKTGHHRTCTRESTNTLDVPNRRGPEKEWSCSDLCGYVKCERSHKTRSSPDTDSRRREF